MEKIPNIASLLLVGIPTRGVYLSKLLAKYLEELSGQPIENGCLDPTFHRDDLASVGTRITQVTDLPSSVDDKEVVLIDDVLFTGRSIRAALSAIDSYGRPKSIELLVLVDRRFSRHLPIQPDYLGAQIDALQGDKVKVVWSDLPKKSVVYLEKNKT